MADNVGITTGTDATIATDDVGGVQYQRVKLDVGGDGLSVPLVASALADNTANPTVPEFGAYLVGYNRANDDWDRVTVSRTNGDGLVAHAAGNLVTQSRMMVYNGATFDRVRGDTTNGVDVDVTRLPALAAGTNTIGNVIPVPNTSGGLSIGKLISAGSTNATSLKGSAGQVYSIYAHNTNAAVRYLKLYNKATSPTVGTDTPVITFPIPGNTAGNGAVLDTGGMGIAFGTGIAYATTVGVADANASAVAADEIVLTILYK